MTGGNLAKIRGLGKFVSTVKDLVVESGIRFEDRRTHRLKGVPDGWR
jgi:hypothetical protein